MPLLRPGYEGDNRTHENLRLLRISPFEVVLFDTARGSLRVLRIIGDAESEVQSLEVMGFRELAIRYIANFETERFLDREEAKAQADRLARMHERSGRWRR